MLVLLMVFTLLPSPLSAVRQSLVEEVNKDLTFRFGKLMEIDLGRTEYSSGLLKPTPFLEEDLRVTGAYLYNGNGGSKQGFIVQYNSTTKTHMILAGNFTQVHHSDMLDFNQEWPADRTHFDTLGMVTQLNRSHVLIPEYQRACIRIFNRDRNTIGPFIGICKQSKDEGTRVRPIWLSDFAQYTIDKPFSITVSPYSNTLYVVDYMNGGNLHQVDLITRVAFALGRFPARQPAYSILLNSDEAIGYLRTEHKIVRLNLTEAERDFTNTTSSFLKYEDVSEFPQYMIAINDMKWLKENEVIIASDGENRGLIILDLRQELVSAICRSDDGNWIKYTGDYTTCSLMKPDLIVVSRYMENTLVLADLTREKVANITRYHNTFYQFEYRELVCSDDYLDVNNDTSLVRTVMNGSMQYQGSMHSYTCSADFYSPYYEIKCVGKDWNMIWVPPLPNCQSGNLTGQDLKLSRPHGPLYGGFELSIINGVFPPELNHTVHIVVGRHEEEIINTNKTFDEIAFIVPSFITYVDTTTKVVVVISSDGMNRSFPFHLLVSPVVLTFSLPEIVTFGVVYDIVLDVKHSNSSDDYELIVNNGQLSICERSNELAGKVICPVNNYSNTRFSLTRTKRNLLPNLKGNLDLQSYGHSLATREVKFRDKPLIFTITSQFSKKDDSEDVRYEIVGENLEQFGNNRLYAVSVKLPQKPAENTICTTVVYEERITGSCPIKDFVPNADYDFSVYFGETLLEESAAKISEVKDDTPALEDAEIVGISVCVVLVVAVVVVIFVLFECKRHKQLKRQADLLKKLNSYTDVDELRKDSDYAVLMDKLQRMLIEEEFIKFSDEVIGEGNFGRICVGYYHTPNGEKRKAALKSMKGDVLSLEQLTQFVNECLLMYEFDHENVLPALGVVLPTNRPITVVLPYMANGDLKRMLGNPKVMLTQGELLNFGLQISNGMDYLSSKHFIHRDLAARNCLVSDDFTIKVADFGLSKDIYRHQYYRISSKSPPLPVKWMALESLSAGSFSSASDVWSFGVVLWELLTRGTDPYPDVSSFDMKNYLLTGRRLEQPQHCCESVYKLMKSCWRAEISQRPTFKQIGLMLQLLLTDFKDSEISRKVSTSSSESSGRVRRLSADGIYSINCTQSDLKRCVSYESLRTMMYQDAERPYIKVQYPYPYEHVDYKTMLPDLLV